MDTKFGFAPPRKTVIYQQKLLSVEEFEWDREIVRRIGSNMVYRTYPFVAVGALLSQFGAPSPVNAGEHFSDLPLPGIPGISRRMGSLSAFGNVGDYYPLPYSIVDDEKDASSKMPSDTKIAAAIDKARAFAYQNTHAPLGPLGKLAATQLLTIGKAMGIPTAELQNARVANHGAFAKAVTDNYIYTIDMAGNQTFRPISNVPKMSLRLNRKSDASISNVPVDFLNKYTLDIARILKCGEVADLSDMVVDKEVIAIGQCGTRSHLFYDGRYLTRWCSKDNHKYFQVMYDSNFQPIRIDTNVPTETSKQLTDYLFKGLKSNLGKTLALADDCDQFTFGTFFSPMEARFELNAFSYEGETSTYNTGLISLDNNPYKSGGFDVSNFNFLDVGAYRQSSDYKWNVNEGWRSSGRLGGARGNFNASTNSWEKPQVSISHYSLEDYTLVGGEPTETKSMVLSDGRSHMRPFAVGRQFEPKFYSDLEGCTVAIFFTHSGPIGDRLQIARGIDVWTKIGNKNSKFGSGNTRHIIFHGCSTMGSFKEGEGSNNPKFLTLFDEWMPGSYINGLRTVSGVDGEEIGACSDGRHFHQRYNQGDGITDSFALGSLDGFNRHTPVTVAFGASPEEAFLTLADGRFSNKRTQSNWAVSSIWRKVKH